MKILVGTVVDGRVVVEEDLDEGATVTLLVEREEDPVAIVGEARTAFVEAMHLIRGDEVIAPEDVLD